MKLKIYITKNGIISAKRKEVQSMRNFKFILLLIALILIITPVYALETENDKSAVVLKTLFASKSDELKASEYFTDNFLKAVPENKIKQLLSDLSPKLGKLNSIVKISNGTYKLIFSKGHMPSKISLDSKNLIAGLWFGNPTLLDDSLDKITDELKKLDGTVSVMITKNGSDPVFLLNPDLPLGVGSSFKLYVLKALNEKIKEGGCDNKTVIEISESGFSLPSGMLQSWPDKTPVTLKTLANLMISISDNTATDILINYLGREYIEKYAPDRMKPFLKTIEMFKLKWSASQTERDEYISAGVEKKRKILDKLSALDKSKIKINQGKPVFIEHIEWFTTTRELCGLISELKGEPALSINKGLADPDSWHEIGYKGGSEPGVLNYTHILQKKANGDFYAVSVTINNATAEVQTEKFTELTGRIISLIENEKMAAAK